VQKQCDHTEIVNQAFWRRLEKRTRNRAGRDRFSWPTETSSIEAGAAREILANTNVKKLGQGVPRTQSTKVLHSSDGHRDIPKTTERHPESRPLDGADRGPNTRILGTGKPNAASLVWMPATAVWGGVGDGKTAGAGWVRAGLVRSSTTSYTRGLAPHSGSQKNVERIAQCE